MLPLDGERHAEAQVLAPVPGPGRGHPRDRRGTPQGRGRVRGVHRERDGACRRPDARRHAAALLSMLDGPTSHILIGLQTPESAVAALDTHLDRLLAR
ncbi:hypothetical protein [Actinocrispum sp. NPDC049592]|uniref:hypothetical protein n=1 Tax=Actinocrispum sp. NPDC049592 TaxID=3154835 RepID=UPI00341DD4F9